VYNQKREEDQEENLGDLRGDPGQGHEATPATTVSRKKTSAQLSMAELRSVEAATQLHRAGS